MFISIGASLQEVAAQMGITPQQAYAVWHAHGQQVATAWQAPWTTDPASADHVVRGGKVFAIDRLPRQDRR